MAPNALPDPVISLIEWLKDERDKYDFWVADKEPAITHYPQTKEAEAIYEKSALVVGIKSSGIGAGQGQLAMGRYESMRIDAVASAHNDFEAWQLGKLMHAAILKVRGRSVQADYEGIDYTTKFVNIYQSGGPAPFQDAPGAELHWRSVLYVYSVNFTTIVKHIEARAILPGLTAQAAIITQ